MFDNSLTVIPANPFLGLYHPLGSPKYNCAIIISYIYFTCFIATVSHVLVNPEPPVKGYLKNDSVLYAICVVPALVLYHSIARWKFYQPSELLQRTYGKAMKHTKHTTTLTFTDGTQHDLNTLKIMNLAAPFDQYLAARVCEKRYSTNVSKIHYMHGIDYECPRQIFALKLSDGTTMIARRME